MKRWMPALLMLIAVPSAGQAATPCDSLETSCEQIASVISYSGSKSVLAVLPIQSDSIPCNDVIEVALQPTTDPSTFLTADLNGFLTLDSDIKELTVRFLRTACTTIRALPLLKRPRVVRFVSVVPLKAGERLILYEAIWNPTLGRQLYGDHSCNQWTEISGQFLAKESEPFQYRMATVRDIFRGHK